MVSTTAILILLIALFIMGIKWAIDLIREWPRKKPVSNHFGTSARVDHIGNPIRRYFGRLSKAVRYTSQNCK